MKKQGLIFVISGPSGSGKTTLVEHLLKNMALRKNLAKSISCTTRPKRSGERSRREYFFVTEKEFKRLQQAKKILEWTRYLGYYYATPRDFIEAQLKKGKHVLLCLDLKGAFRIKRLYPEEAVLIFITPPSLSVLRERIRGRCHRTKKEEIRERLKLAKQELLVSARYDYTLANKTLRESVEKLGKIIEKEIGLRTA